MTADPLNLAALTVEQRDAVMTPWWEVAKAEDWDADADQLYWAAVDALAWTLVDTSMDTADREPSAEFVQQARATAERMLLAGARLDLAERATAAEAAHRDLVSRLGFGDNITEPMADNDTVVAWVEALDADASEWRESQRWRDECYAAGHPDDEDCYEHDPARRLEAAEAAVERVRALADQWEAWDAYAQFNYGEETEGPAYARALRAALDLAPASEVRDDEGGA